MEKNKKIDPTQIILYRAGDRDVAVEVYLRDETFWLSQKTMAKLFDCSIDNVSLHLKNIFKDGELEKSNCFQNGNNSNWRKERT